MKSELVKKHGEAAHEAQLKNKFETDLDTLEKQVRGYGEVAHDEEQLMLMLQREFETDFAKIETGEKQFSTTSAIASSVILNLTGGSMSFRFCLPLFHSG